MFTFPLTDRSETARSVNVPMKEQTYDGFVHQNASLFEHDQHGANTTADYHIDVGDLRRYLDYLRCNDDEIPELSTLEKENMLSRSNPYASVLRQMVKILRSGPDRSPRRKDNEAQEELPVSYHVALECLQSLRALDDRQYFTTIFDFIQMQLLFGVRRNEELQFVARVGQITEKNSSNHSSPVFAWLEDSIVHVIQHTLTTHFITADIAVVARKLWVSLPSILLSKGIVPQRRYMQAHCSNHERSESMDMLLSSVTDFDQSDCGGTFSYDVRSISEYTSMIPYPLSIPDIKQNYSAGNYASLQQLYYDLELMLLNCAIYNPPDTSYYAHAKSLYGLVFSWMVENAHRATETSEYYWIDFEEHIANKALLKRIGGIIENISLKATPMRDTSAANSVDFFDTFYSRFDCFAYLRASLELPQLNAAARSYLKEAHAISTDNTVSSTHPKNMHIDFLYECILLLSRYAVSALHTRSVEKSTDSHHSLLNIEGFQFDPSNVEQYPLMKHRYWCIYQFPSIEDEVDEVNIVDAITRQTLKSDPCGEMLLTLNSFFQK